MQEKKLDLKTSVMWNTAGNLFYNMCQWLMTVLVIRIAGVDQGGILTLAISVCNIWQSISLFGMHNFQASDEKNEYSDDTYLKSRYITATIGLVGVLVYLIIKGYSTEQNICIIMFYFLRITEALQDVYFAIFQNAWRLDIPGKSMLIRGTVSILAFSLVLKLSGNLAITIAVDAVLCMLVVFVYDSKKLKKIESVNKNIDKACVENIFSLLRKCFPLAAYVLLANFTSLVPRLIMESTLGNYKLGIFGSVASPVVIVQLIFINMFTPYVTVFAEKYTNRDKKGFYKALLGCIKIVVIFSLIFLIGGVLLGKLGLTIIYGKEVAEYSSLLIPMIISSILVAITSLFSNVLTAIRKFKELMIGNSIMALLSFLSASYLENKFDMQGANYCTIFALGMGGIVLFLFVNMSSKKRFRT